MHVVCYHYPCPDGVFAALAAHIALERPGAHTRAHTDAPAVDTRPTGVRYVPLTVYQPMEERLRICDSIGPEDTVYLLDFSGGTPFLLGLCARAQCVHLRDHHKTAAEDIQALKDAGTMPANLVLDVDMHRSGATIARDSFDIRSVLPESVAAGVLRLYDYIEDHVRRAWVPRGKHRSGEHVCVALRDVQNDLWRHALPQSREFSAGLGDMQLEYDVNKNASLWDTLLALSVEAVIARGVEALATQARLVAEDCARAFPVRLCLPGTDGTSAPRCLAVLTEHSELRSVMGNELARLSAAAGMAPAGVVAYVEEGMGDAAASAYKVSVRSTGAFDTTAFTKAYGGGGHVNASSCIMPRTAFEALRETAPPPVL